MQIVYGLVAECGTDKYISKSLFETKKRLEEYKPIFKQMCIDEKGFRNRKVEIIVVVYHLFN